MKYFILTTLILISGLVYSADLQMDGWNIIPVAGSGSGQSTKVYSKTQAIGDFQLRSMVTHTISDDNKINNVIDEIEIKFKSDSDDKYLNIGRCITLNGGNVGFWMFLNSFNEKYQVYGGVAGNDGLYFAKSKDRFVVIQPKVLTEKNSWVVMLIADSQGVYHAYDKSDYKKYDVNVK